jgi:hypothetical protein
MTDWMKRRLDERDQAQERQKHEEEEARTRNDDFLATAAEYFSGLGQALQRAVDGWNADERNIGRELTMSSWGNGWMIRHPKMPGGDVAIELNEPIHAILCDYTFQSSVFPNQPKSERRSKFGLLKVGAEWQFNGRVDPTYATAVQEILEPLIKWAIDHRK